MAGEDTYYHFCRGFTFTRGRRPGIFQRASSRVCVCVAAVAGKLGPERRDDTLLKAYSEFDCKLR